MAKASSKAPKKPAAETPVPPYYLQKARVKDYPPIRDAEVEFKPGLNIIIGTNGAGKTRFLRSVAIGIDSLLNSHAEVVGSSFLLKGPAQVSITHLEPADKPTQTLYHRNPRAQVQFDDLLPTEGADVFEAWLNQTIKETSASETLEWPAYWVHFIRHHLPDKHLPLLEQDAQPKLTARFERTSATTNFTLSLIESLRLEAVHQQKQQKSSLAEPEITALAFKTIAHYLDALNDYLPRYSPIEEARVSPLLRFYVSPEQQQTVINGLFLEYKTSGEWRPFQELSDGTKRLVYLISDLITPEPGAASSRQAANQPSRIILLEEPELGIHPHQLHLLLNLIREVSEKHQVILTTHSPQVLDMLKADELDRILICELKDPKKGTQFRRLNRKQMVEAKAYISKVGFLSDYWLHSDLEETESV